MKAGPIGRGGGATETAPHDAKPPLSAVVAAEVSVCEATE